MALVIGSTPTIEKRFAGRGYGEFKTEVADVVCHLLEQIQTNYQHFKNPEILQGILQGGAYRARQVASETLERAKRALGLT